MWFLLFIIVISVLFKLKTNKHQFNVYIYNVYIWKDDIYIYIDRKLYIVHIRDLGKINYFIIIFCYYLRENV